MFKPIFNVIGIAVLMAVFTGCSKTDDKIEKSPQPPQKTIYDFTMTSIDAQPVPLSKYKGSVVMIVNVASRCGATPQYAQLQAIFEKYNNQGFYILGFPANNFGKQEPGTNQQIKQFCTENYNVTFPMFAKISVKGTDIDPLYEFLTSPQTNPDHSGEITWNFNKFLIDKNGRIINRFSTKTKPDDPNVITAIENAIKN